MSNASDSPHSIPVLNSQIPLPPFAFFQLVKVRMTGEAALIVGMKYGASSQEADDQSEEWVYLLYGLTRFSSVWWKVDQLHNFDRR